MNGADIWTYGKNIRKKIRGTVGFYAADVV
jgi:hypothetical protein